MPVYWCSCCVTCHVIYQFGDRGWWLEFRVIYVCHLDRDPTVVFVLLGHRSQPRSLVGHQRVLFLRMLLLLSRARFHRQFNNVCFSVFFSRRYSIYVVIRIEQSIDFFCNRNYPMQS